MTTLRQLYLLTPTTNGDQMHAVRTLAKATLKEIADACQVSVKTVSSRITGCGYKIKSPTYGKKK